MTNRHNGRYSGFTLIEVLVALAIISIALLASLRVAAIATNSVGELRSRLLAGWVAGNVLADQRARGVWLPVGMQQGVQDQAGMQFSWREEVADTPNSAFRRVDVRVYSTPEDTHALAHLVGFLARVPGGSP